MGCAPVQFSYPLWVETFPEFASVAEPQAGIYFDLATIVQRNDGTGPVTKPATQLALLNIMTAHIASLFVQSLDDPSPGSPKDANSPVGRISSAAEGSVSIQTDYGTTIGQQQAWLIQSKYGAAWWSMTAVYRTFRHVAGSLQPGATGYNPGGIGTREFR